jgi:hypothetical protein
MPDSPTAVILNLGLGTARGALDGSGLGLGLGEQTYDKKNIMR